MPPPPPQLSEENADVDYYCFRRGNNTWWDDWGKLSEWKTLYANPPFSKIPHTLTKVYIDNLMELPRLRPHRHTAAHPDTWSGGMPPSKTTKCRVVPEVTAANLQHL